MLLALVFVVAVVIAQVCVAIACIVKAAKARYGVALIAASIALASAPIALLAGPAFAPLSGVTSLIGGGIVVGTAWRRKAVLPAADPAVAQSSVVMSAFLALAVLGLVEGPILWALATLAGSKR
jgi:hypothetical protein